MADPALMHLTLHQPTETIFDASVRRVVARGPHGAFGILPNHIDCACPLVLGLLTVEQADGTEIWFGLDEGVLVKTGGKLRIGAFRAFRSDSLADMQNRIEAAFLQIDERDRAARVALSRLEANIARELATELGGTR